MGSEVLKSGACPVALTIFAMPVRSNIAPADKSKPRIHNERMGIVIVIDTRSASANGRIGLKPLCRREFRRPAKRPDLRTLRRAVVLATPQQQTPAQPGHIQDVKFSGHAVIVVTDGGATGGLTHSQKIFPVPKGKGVNIVTVVVTVTHGVPSPLKFKPVHEEETFN
jgi:hypothetical protein